MIDWIFSQTAEIHFLADSWSTREEYKILDAFVNCSKRQHRFLSDRRIKKCKFGCDFTLFEQFSTIQLRGIFGIYMHCLGKTAT